MLLQDEATAVWARVQASFQQSVYIGMRPSLDVAGARSHTVVLRRQLELAHASYPFSVDTPVALPAPGRVTLQLVDNDDLKSFKEALNALLRSSKRLTKSVNAGKGDDDDASTVVSHATGRSGSTLVQLRTSSHALTGTGYGWLHGTCALLNMQSAWP